MKKTNVSNTALIVGLICILMAALMMFGSAMGLWEPIVGFSASRSYNNILGYIATTIGCIALIFSLVSKHVKSIVKSLIAVSFGLIILAPTLINMIKEPVGYPPIHDITTDTQTPPLFTYLTDDRPGAKNTLVYGGEEIAQQQINAFPTIKPILSALSPEKAFDKAITIADTMGWQVVSKKPESYIFEATARTAFFNFADDVVIRVMPEENGSRIDMRSVSRIGRGDRGMNAQRIKQFTYKFMN